MKCLRSFESLPGKYNIRYSLSFTHRYDLVVRVPVSKRGKLDLSLDKVITKTLKMISNPALSGAGRFRVSVGRTHCHLNWRKPYPAQTKAVQVKKLVV
jgi:hypothetical protein